MIKKELESHGHVVIEADNGITGLCKVMDEEVDLLILDYYLLPDSEGSDVVRLLRAMEKGRNLPLIMIFARSPAVDTLQLMREWNDAGTVGKLLKPFGPLNPRELSALIADFAAQRS